ncbi:hypothetical protein FQK02_21400 [Xanthomonas vasicola]|uniref:Uncharacterized protein n=1 Tax=Xanthomonas vasicola pv. vasculorum NCPPB 890 TaxID=1184265 RepID=A0A836P4H3_XANVA|nr:hypothetical protein [Xanthomonas vasicola]KFA25861.1 hypothetical protein KW5_0115455 [Xanthomonas vasicola pv. vasculorum NCPPB 1326]KFA27231.1 hypothetical protein KWG_0121975 [Xanthomonas vasicola pv. vasculorum NCPPB 1381]MBV6746266.1 hypothetical protein [Xanthomonas vasicola pv. vasculorum NCPPB 890]MBV6891333.1 hypothetical protein [Xanthomonas vasicola pv. vasculorum]MDO6949003.1 hypothetical protein [Xanthomonas vasicola]
MDHKYVTQSVEGYSHALLASAARSFLERSEDAAEEQPNHFALGAMMMCCFALEAYFNQLGHALHERRMLPEIHDIGEFEREAPDKKFRKLIRALDLTLESISLKTVDQFFEFRNRVAHAKPYSREDKSTTWKGAQPLIPSTDPPWAKQARPIEARRFVETMEEVISRMNQASLQKIGQDFPLNVFGGGSQVYCP